MNLPLYQYKGQVAATHTELATWLGISRQALDTLVAQWTRQYPKTQFRIVLRGKDLQRFKREFGAARSSRLTLYCGEVLGMMIRLAGKPLPQGVPSAAIPREQTSFPAEVMMGGSSI